MIDELAEIEAAIGGWGLAARGDAGLRTRGEREENEYSGSQGGSADFHRVRTGHVSETLGIRKMFLAGLRVLRGAVPFWSRDSTEESKFGILLCGQRRLWA